MNNWYVIRTNPKCEERATADLEAAGFEVFFPQMRKEIKHHRTKKWIMQEYPLFTRYLFIRMHNEDWFSVRSANGVECVLGVNGLPIPVPTYVVEQTRREYENGSFDELKQAAPKLKIGERVRIEGGPLNGFHGQVTSATGRKMVKVLIEMFKSGREVDVPLESVAKMG